MTNVTENTVGIVGDGDDIALLEEIETVFDVKLFNEDVEILLLLGMFMTILAKS